MIALKHALPLVRGAHGVAVALESTWLHVAIQDAAGRAGYPCWWLINDLVAGISLYLSSCYVQTVIDVPELETLVRDALCNIGYEEVAATFRAIPPTREISLVQCLQSTPLLNRLKFFEKVSEKIALLYENQVRHFHFYDLHACVDQWENEAAAGRLPRSARLREKIVAFVRERVHSQDWDQQVWYSIT